MSSDLYKTQTVIWKTGVGHGFQGWQLSGIKRVGKGTIELDPDKAREARDPYPAGGYKRRNFYNGGRFVVGEADGPLVSAEFPFTQAIASWNTDTPPGTWIEVQARAQINGRLTKWYSMGVWASDSSTVER